MNAPAIEHAMTPLEAMRKVQIIRESLNRAARELSIAKAAAVELYERDGWRAVMQPDGTIKHYNNWPQCVKAEYSKSMATVYRYLKTGTVERSIAIDGQPIPSLAHSWAEELCRLPIPLRRAALELAEQQTPAHKKTTVKEIRAACQALEVAYHTNGFVPVAGEMIGLGAAITENLSEELATATQRVKDHNTAPIINTRGFIAQVGYDNIVLTVTTDIATAARSLIDCEVQIIVKDKTPICQTQID